MERFKNESYEVEMLSPWQKSVYTQTYKHLANDSKLFPCYIKAACWHDDTHSQRWKQYHPHCHGWSQILCNFRCVSTFQQSVTITCTDIVKRFHPLVKNMFIMAAFRSSDFYSSHVSVMEWEWIGSISCSTIADVGTRTEGSCSLCVHQADRTAS